MKRGSSFFGPSGRRSPFGRISGLVVVGLLVVVLALSSLGACGGKKEEAKTPTPTSNTEDALALLPGNAIMIGSVDARAFFGSQSFGPELARLVEKYVPIGQEAGFQASRDVDRVTFGSYSYQGIDVGAIVIGRFDEAKIKQVAAQQTPVKGGGVLVASQYAGHDLYTVNNVGFTLLSSTRAIAGTESGIRRVLERIKDGRVKRDIAGWMLTTVETPGAAAAVAVDFATQPIPAETLRHIPVPFIQTSKAMRVLVTFKEPGLQVAGSMTYADGPSAQTAADQVRSAAKYVGLLLAMGIKVQNIDIKPEQSDVQVKLDVDDQSLRQVLVLAPQWLGQ